MDSRPAPDADCDDRRARAARIQMYAVRAVQRRDRVTGRRLAAADVVLPAYRGCCTQPGYEGKCIVRNILIDLVSDVATHLDLVDESGQVAWPLARPRTHDRPHAAIAARFATRVLELARQEESRGRTAPIRVVLSGEAPVYVYIAVVTALQAAGIATAVEDACAGRIPVQG